MINRALWRKSFSEAKWLLLGCALAVFAFCWVRVWIVSRLDMSSFQIVLEQLWDTWGKFSPVPLEQVLTYPGRIAWTFTEPIVVLAVAIFAIGRGSDVVSGELGRGTMEMLLAQPISRIRILLTQSTVTLLGILAISLMVWIGIWAGVQTNSVNEKIRPKIRIPGVSVDMPNPLARPKVVQVPMQERVDPDVYWPATVNLFSVGFFLAGMTTFLSSWDRYRWRTIGIAATILVTSSILKIVADASATLHWLSLLSFFEAYQPEWSVSVAVHSAPQQWSFWMAEPSAGDAYPGPLGYSSILIALGLIGYVLSAIIFCRRDLPAPL